MILVLGATGFLGRAVCAALPRTPPIHHWLGRRKDLREPRRLESTLRALHPATVIHLAYPGTEGIGTALTGMADLVHDMLLIDLQVIQACALASSQPHLICVGSVCSYPEHVQLPADERQLWVGRPELWNEPYGQAKRMQISLLDAYRRQYALPSTHLILDNLYGPGDKSGHVIPATIRKVRKAQAEGATSIDVWGDGTATREFLHVDDAARAIVAAVNTPPQPQPINIASGEEVPIARLVEQVCQHIGWTGTIHWDTTKPNGQPRRHFSNTRALVTLGWSPQIRFADGLRATIDASPL